MGAVVEDPGVEVVLRHAGRPCKNLPSPLRLKLRRVLLRRATHDRGIRAADPARVDAARGDAYGLSIREHIEARAGRPVSAGALYTALDRLEKRGLVSSRLGEPTPQRGGKRKRLYTVQPAGARALEEAYETLQRMAAGLESDLKAIRS
jgi:hypothetical protein